MDFKDIISARETTSEHHICKSTVQKTDQRTNTNQTAPCYAKNKPGCQQSAFIFQLKSIKSQNLNINLGSQASSSVNFPPCFQT